jgi:hypothetical protein
VKTQYINTNSRGTKQIRALLLIFATLFLAGISRASTATAAYVGCDTTTTGNWQGAYGGDGYTLANGPQSIPAYATFAVQSQNNWTWASGTNDPRALETGTSAGRIAAAWYNSESFDFDINFTDGNPHQLALYAVDWDLKQRTETIQILDAASGTVLDTRTLADFINGNYLVWTLSGHVRIDVTMTSLPNAVVSGVFFGGAKANAVTVSVNPQHVTLNHNQQQQFAASVTNTSNQAVTWSISPSSGSISSSGLYTAPSTITGSQAVTVTATAAGGATATATVNLTTGATANFATSDTSTQGNWKGKYGADGYSVANSSQSIPSYATFAVENQSNWTWAAPTSDPRALDTTSNPAGIASAWYNPSSFTFDVDFTDGNSHQLSLYALDWDSKQRAETIEIIDPSTNSVLDKRSVTGFSGGVYLIWNVSGNVQISVTSTAGPNGAITAVFFGGAGSSTSSAAPSAPTSPVPAVAAAVLSASPSSVSFGSVNVGSGVSQPISLTNSGTTTVTISEVSIAGAGFDASGVSSGVVIPAGQSATLNVSFTPAASGSATGSITIPSNAATVSISLTGTGVQPVAPSYSVSLTWLPSSSSGVIGYYVYRALGAGSYTQITPTPVTTTSYTDSTVQAGDTYEYAVTSVSSDGMQSAYSNAAFATIP